MSDTTDSFINDVSDTAFWVAHYRALETDRKNSLFKDPLAKTLAGSLGGNIANSMKTSKMTEWVVILRTFIIDNFITEQIKNDFDLVLNLGAGLDTRPYRMQLPKDLTWIEVDYPKVIEFKEKILMNEKPKCKLERIRLDLSNSEERKSLFNSINQRGKKILILTEGVVIYLSNSAAAELATDLYFFDNFKLWIVDYISPEAAAYRDRRQSQNKMKNAALLFSPKNWFEFFENQGW
ncbi:MAG: class I SAM-dependent methyltransferase, partial [Bdellovibrionales bacterium]|nr:class I SAM-dependent methyltransferase [Bdellovibrionales bacterium]